MGPGFGTEEAARDPQDRGEGGQTGGTGREAGRAGLRIGRSWTRETYFPAAFWHFLHFSGPPQ